MIPFDLDMVIDPPAWLKKVIVVSHERSGTHFLMNALDENFGYMSYPFVNFDLEMPVNFWAPENILSWLNPLKGKPVLNLFKSHHQAEFFSLIIDELLEEFHIFYVYRNGHDVMESFCKHINFFDWHMGPRKQNGTELAQAQPEGAMLRYQKRQYSTIWDRWEKHVAGWRLGLPKQTRDKIIYVKFEDLDQRFDETMKNIADRIGTICLDPRRPDKYNKVVTPDIMTQGVAHASTH